MQVRLFSYSINQPLKYIFRIKVNIYDSLLSNRGASIGRFCWSDGLSVWWSVEKSVNNYLLEFIMHSRK
jgi:hypothetical protein